MNRLLPLPPSRTHRLPPLVRFVLLGLLQQLQVAEASLALPLTAATAAGSKGHPQQQNQRQSQRPSVFPNSQPAKPTDVETLVRQTGQVNPSRAAIGTPRACQCRHGFPQAFAMDPMHGGRMNSGLLKLTCPHLVRAVDALEDDGVMDVLNARIGSNDSSNSELQTEMRETHAIHAKVRTDMLSDAEQQQVQTKLGDQGARSFLEAGVAGASPGSHDIKCLHAWLADALFRGTTPSTTTATTANRLGKSIVQELQARNMDLSGVPDCHTLCDPTANQGLANPPKPRNKQRLRTSKEAERRKRRKQEQEEQ